MESPLSSVSSSSSSSPPTPTSISSATSLNNGSKVVIRCGHIIPMIRLTPPDSRPAMAPSLPEQDLGPNSLYVPLRTEEVGWEEGGLIWAPKRYCYPTVNLYGGSDDHVIGTYRGGPKGYRFIDITDKAFSVASPESEEDCNAKSSKTSKDGSKSSMPTGPATKMQEETVPEEVEDQANSKNIRTPSVDSMPASSRSSSTASSTSSSRRGSSSTDDCDGDSSGADTGMTTPMSEDTPSSTSEKQEELAEKLGEALSVLKDEERESGRESKKTKLASRAGSMEIENKVVDSSLLAGSSLKTHLKTNNILGFDKTLTLSHSVPSSHFNTPRGRSTSRRIIDDSDYAAGWSYEQNMRRDFHQY